MHWFNCLDTEIADEFLQGSESKTFEEVTFHTFSNGISLSTHKKVLKYIIFFPNYTEKLPYGLMWSHTNSEVVQKCGEPDRKVNSKAFGIEITYNELGLAVEFVNCDWNDPKNPVKSIILFRGKMVNPFSDNCNAILCSFCHLNAKSRCSRCNLFYYCSRECQIQHWKVHKKACDYIKTSN